MYDEIKIQPVKRDWVITYELGAVERTDYIRYVLFNKLETYNSLVMKVNYNEAYGKNGILLNSKKINHNRVYVDSDKKENNDNNNR